MGRFDRYLLGQLLVLFGFFSLVLVLVYWINRAVRLFDQLIANGQSASVFFEFSALTLPNVIRLVLPMAAFAASVYVANRLSQESELVVVQATGYSPWRLARPVLAFGAIVAAMLLVLTHLLVPLSFSELGRRQAEISANVTARFLTEGQFMHPGKGYTFYVREIAPDGTLLDIFLNDASAQGSETTYTARLAQMQKGSDGRTRLVMFDGAAQQLEHESQRLGVTTFADFSVDVSALLDTGEGSRSHPRELPTGVLLARDAALIEEANSSEAQFLYEAHSRTAQALLALVAPLIGFASLLIGGFSRFGLWRQILMAIFMLIVVKSLDNAAARLVLADVTAWPLTYLAALIGLVLAGLLLWIAERPRALVRLRRRLS